MKSLFWNVRGLANSPSRLALKRFLCVNKPDFCFISEPWMEFESLPRGWFANLGYKLFAMNNRDTLQPNLWCLCTISLNPTIVQSTDQFVAFTFDFNNVNCGMVAIYASTCYIKRRHLWSSLQNIHQSISIPWSFIGDFNAILGAYESRGYFTPSRIPMQDFQKWTDSNHFIHLPTTGAEFTWQNGRSGRRFTERRLDRCICNQSWLDMCSSISVSTLLRTCSDHHPILLDFEVTQSRFVSQFKFQKMWTLHEDCRNVVNLIWKLNVVGCPMFILSKKLQMLKVKLRSWNKEVFGNIHQLVKEAEAKLHDIQVQLQTSGYNETNISLEKQAQKNLELTLNKEETFWQEKSKVKWYLEGDRNTAFFHRITKIKNTTKLITSIKDGDNTLSDQNLIANHAVNYFKSLFCTNIVLQDSLLVDEVIPNIVTDNTNQMLTMLPTSDEIHKAVFSLNKEGAPGPDGFGAIFFQTYWDIVKSDVEKAVLQFFTSGWIMPNFNSNTVVLIPKTSNADTMNQYRPIALANFKFKVLSKILADRLSQIMPALISKHQRGFIQGRNIKDYIFTALEAINLLDSKSFGGNIALKVDIAKAFDTLEWSFLLKALNRFGFSNLFCDWIKAIFGSAHLSIYINGSQHGFFQCSRGVRQGDPLSPLLFCLAEEVLSRGISKLVADGDLNLMSGTRGCKVPSHTLYADDIMIFCKGKISCINSLIKLFSSYA